MAGEGNMALHAHGAGLGEGGAAVNDELGAGEVAGLVAGQEGGQLAHLGGVGQAACTAV